jgi:DNA mismatch repair protein MutL
MIHDDALLAFERHATSKLRTADDLLSIATLGFRGEALPSIAAVSRLLLQTRAAEEEEGTRVEFAGGKLVGVNPEGLPSGTTISVADLFYCVPARRNFLKSETTELGHIASLVTHYALAHPDKQFVLKTPTQEIIHATAVETMAERVYQLFGRQALDDLFELLPVRSPMRAAITEAELTSEERAAELVVRGFASRPEVQRGNRNGIYVFVNKRLVRDRLILHAIHEAYRNVLPPAVFPAVLLFLDLPAEEVDVNVHPAKIEVRFRHPQFVHDFTRDSIRQALSRARPIPSFAGVAPTAPGARKQDNGAAAIAAVAGANLSSTGLPRAVIPPLNGPPMGGSATSGPALSGTMMDAAGLTGAAIAGDFELTGAPMRPEAQRFRFEGGIGTAPGEPFSESLQNFSDAEPLASAGSLTELKPLGQVNSSFIVAVNGEGLWIIDQHVAHERVLFEQHLRARREGQLTGQRMLVPMMVELSPRQIVIFERIAEELVANGFEVAQMGPRSVAIHAAPAGIATSDAERLLMEILEGTERENAAISMDSLQAKIAASTSCHAAIKVNMPLDQKKMEWLLGELAKTEAPMSCPHGRPIVLRYSVREIERAFKRI